MTSSSDSPAARAHLDLRGAALLIVFSSVLGLNQSLVKLVNAGIEPMLQSGLRSACAALLLISFMALRERPMPLSHRYLGLGILNGLLFSGEFACLFLALEHSMVARVSLLFYTMPFFVAVGAHFLFPSERLTARRLGGLLLAVSGIALVLLGDREATASPTLLGDLLALAGAACWAGLTLVTRATRLKELPPDQNLFFHLVVSAIVLLALALLSGDGIRDLTPAIAAIFAFQVVVVVCLGFALWFWILSIYPVSVTASFSLLTPLFGVFFGAWIFEETLSAVFYAAIGMVCGGLVLINGRR